MKIPKFEDYPFEIRPLGKDEGGGFLITFPDLPGCMSDGATPEEAMEHGKDAFNCWMSAHIEDGRPIPAPRGGEPVRFVLRLPRNLHSRLAASARADGVSLNSEVLSILSEGMGRRAA